MTVILIMTKDKGISLHLDLNYSFFVGFFTYISGMLFFIVLRHKSVKVTGASNYELTKITYIMS